MVETNRIEFKRELNDKLEREVVAFLNNHEGGVIYIGIDDEGKVVGVDDVDEIQTKITDRIKNNVQPNALGLFDVVIEEKEGKKIVKVVLSSGTEKPYYIKQYGMSPTGCYIRIGSSTVKMTIKQIDDLYSRRLHTSIRNISSPRQDLTFTQLKIFYQGVGLNLNENFTRSLELADDTGRYNYLAYLMADDNGTSIKVAKYAGEDKYDLIENDEYGYCSLIKACQSVLDRLRVENKTNARITPVKRIEKSLVDAKALREVVINAFVHNDWTREIPPVFEIFSDRIEVTSFGGMVYGQNLEDFFSLSSMPRSRELMRIFKDLELVEQLGSGMTRILKVYSRDIFNISNNFIKVTLPFGNIENKTENSQEVRKKFVRSSQEVRKKFVKKSTLSMQEQRVLDLLAENDTLTASSMAEQMRISTRQIQKYLRVLQEKGIIQHVGSKKGGHWDILIDLTNFH